MLKTLVFSLSTSALSTPNTGFSLRRGSSHHQFTEPLPRVYYEHINRILSLREEASYQETVYQRILSHAWQMRLASLALVDAFDKYAPTPDLNGERGLS